MGACSSECPVVLTLRELENGKSDLREAGLLKNVDVRISTIGLCRAILEAGTCESGPVAHADPDGADYAWIVCGNSRDVDITGLSEVVGAHSDSCELNIRKETGTTRVASAITDFRTEEIV